MQSDPNPRRRWTANGLPITAAIAAAAVAISAGISLRHPTGTASASRNGAVASASPPDGVPALAEGASADPSVPGAAEALRGSGGADGDPATTF
jgi:hypothetical protein